MNNDPEHGISRRTAVGWTAAAAAAIGGGLGARHALREYGGSAGQAKPLPGYGKDPQLVEPSRKHWPRTIEPLDRRRLEALLDIVLPELPGIQSGVALGLVDFFEEWLSAPYPDQIADREQILRLLGQLKDGPGLQRRVDAASADPAFRRFCVLAAAAYYTTPAGFTAIGFVGGEPLAKFEGPPTEVLAHFKTELGKLASRA